MNILLKKVTTPQVIPSGTGQTVSTNSSKNIGILLFKNTPRRIQEAYNVTEIKTQTGQFPVGSLCPSRQVFWVFSLISIDSAGSSLFNALIMSDKASYICHLFAPVGRQGEFLWLDAQQFNCFIFLVAYSKAQKQFYHYNIIKRILPPQSYTPSTQRDR